MKNTRFDYIFIGIIIFAVFIVCEMAIVSDMNINYASIGTNISTSDVDDIMARSNDSLTQINTIAYSLNNKTLESDVSSSTAWDSLIQGTYSSIRLISNGFGMIGDILSVIASKIGIPPFMVGAFIIIFIIGVVFSIIYMIFRFRP